MLPIECMKISLAFIAEHYQPRAIFWKFAPVLPFWTWLQFYFRLKKKGVNSGTWAGQLHGLI